MRNALLLSCLIAAFGTADAALVERSSGQPLRLWLGEEGIQAGTMNAVGVDTHVVATGQGNIVRNSIGMIRSGSTKGSVSINAVGRGTRAVAIGSGNTATNDIGTIGNW